jgi:hypothetical protein
VPVPSTPRFRAAARVAGWKHGKYARVVTGREATEAQIDRKFGHGTAEMIAAHMDCDPQGLERVGSIALAQKEIIRRQIVQGIFEKGVLVEEAMVGSDGEPVGSRLKAHPGLEPLRHLDEQLGHTADQQQITKKSRGEGAVNAAVAFRLSRDQALRALDEKRIALPPPAIEAEVVKS